MANPEHLKILKQGVDVWNKWRKDNPDVEPDLIGVMLPGADLTGARLSKGSFKEAYLRGADFRGADLGGADLGGANLDEANLAGLNIIEANLCGAELNKADLSGANLSEANLGSANLRSANLRGANLRGAYLRNADLVEANLVEANLRGADLSEAKLRGADLTEINFFLCDIISTDLANTNLTGACLYGTARDNWKIERIKCDYIYFDPGRKERIPKDRDFRPGEFEELYRSLPTIEYYFENGFTPLDAVIMDKIVQAINEKHPEFELKLDSFHSRGMPHAKFTVLQRENAHQAYQQISFEYETKIKVLEGQKEQLMDVIALLSNKPDEKVLKLIETMAQRPQTTNIIYQFIEKYSEGDIISLKSGGHIAFAKDEGKSSIRIGNNQE